MFYIALTVAVIIVISLINSRNQAKRRAAWARQLLADRELNRIYRTASTEATKYGRNAHSCKIRVVREHHLAHME